jgi:hypothetical protein
MKDSDARGIVLERFYDARHKVDYLSLHALSTHVPTISIQTLGNICEQLGQYDLIDWQPGDRRGRHATDHGDATRSQHFGSRIAKRSDRKRLISKRSRLKLPSLRPFWTT